MPSEVKLRTPDLYCQSLLRLLMPPYSRMSGRFSVRAIVWHGLDGCLECDRAACIEDGTDALVWVVNNPHDNLAGIVLEVGIEVGTVEAGDRVILPGSVGAQCRSSSLWGLTEFPGLDERRGHIVRVPLAEFNLFRLGTG